MDNHIADLNHTEDEEEPVVQNGNVDKPEEDIRPSDDEDNSSGEEREGLDDETHDSSSSDKEDGYPQWAGGRPRAPAKKTVTGNKNLKYEPKTSSSDKDKSKDKDNKGSGSNSKKTEQPVAGPASKK